MKIKKRFVVFGGIALLLIVLVGCGLHYGPWGKGFHSRPWDDKNMPDVILQRLDSKVNDLKLTPVQKEKYNELRASLKTHLSEAKEDHKKFKEVVRSEIAKDTPDITGLTVTMKKKVGDMSVIIQNDLDLFAAFYGSLDSIQKQKVVKGIREKMAGYGPCR